MTSCKFCSDGSVEQPGEGLSIFGPLKDTIDNSSLASSLVKRGAAIYYSERQMGSAVYRCQRAIALWPTADQLAKIHDSGSQLQALAVLTWSLKDIDLWAGATSAVDLLGVTKVRSVEIQDGVVLGAMRSLTNAINLSSGLAHPLDWDKAVLTFRLLKDRHHQWNPANIEQWAVANGWGAEDARDIREVAEAYANGRSKRLKAGSSPFNTGVIEIWQRIGSEPNWKPY